MTLGMPGRILHTLGETTWCREGNMPWSQVEMILNFGSITYKLQDRSKLLNLSGSQFSLLLIGVMITTWVVVKTDEILQETNP